MFFMKKGVKISLYTLLGVFLALFFIFLLSFDFTPKEAYEVNKSVSEVRKDFDEILRKSIDESKTIKVLNISLDNEFLNNFINANKNENNVDFTSDQWFLKGTKFEVKGERFVLTLYANYSGVINYRFKIRAFFEISEDETKYTLSLIRLNVGGIIMPSFLKKTIFDNTKEGTIGRLIENTIQSINFGTYNSNTLEYTIQKAEIVESIRNGFLGNVAYGDNELLKTATSLYVSSLLNYNLFKLNIKNSVNVVIDYSKLLNDTVEYPSEYNRALNSSKEYLYAIEDVSILEYLVKGQNLALSDDYLSSILRLKFDQYLDIIDDSYINLAKIKNVSMNYHQEHLSLKLVYTFESSTSVIEIKFKKDNNSSLIISSATIGFDQGELSGSYIEINKTSDINILIDLLDKMGIVVNPTSYVLNLKSLTTSSRIDYQDVSFGTNIYGITDVNPYVNEISEAVLSNDFINILPNEFNGLIDNTDVDTLLSSYKALDFDLRIEFLKYLQDYFKETNISVYNYIYGII